MTRTMNCQKMVKVKPELENGGYLRNDIPLKNLRKIFEQPPMGFKF
jgi:hypothetical protein